MINSVEWLPNRILERPACAWWQGLLLVAHLDLNNQVCVTRVSVGGSAVSAVTLNLGLTSPFGPAIAAHQGQIIVAVSADGAPVQVLTSSDGQSFGAPVSLPFTALGPVALASAGRLWMAWRDGDFMLHLGHSSGGLAFTDELTPIRVGVTFALAGADDPDRGPEVAVAWRESTSFNAVLAKFSEPAFDPALPQRVTLPEANIQNLSLTFAPGSTPSGRKIIVGCERFDPPQASSHDTHLFGHTVTNDLSTVTGMERAGWPGEGPGLALGGARAWAAWRDMGTQADHLVVGPYDIAFDLPPELEALLDQECNPADCPPDLRLVCAATEELVWKTETAWIRNAEKGDLVITPASGTGIIGNFLKELDYEQLYDHMGIMIEDHNRVRHATMAHARTKDYYRGSMLGEPAPTDGIRPDVLKYGWPGTITQSVENGFIHGFNDGANPEWVHPDPGPIPPKPAPNDSEAAWKEFWAAVERNRGFLDPENKKSYVFANLTWKPQVRSDGTVVKPIVVKPPPEAEAADPLVRASLHRVADASKTIRGHYRFYCYTQGMIGQSPIYYGPPANGPAWAGLPAGASWAAGTRPLVCSTFIWQAVQEASRNGPPRLMLEGEYENTPEEQHRALTTVVHDGLYRYHADERRRAAKALYEFTRKEVRAQVWEKLMKFQDEFGWLENVIRYGITGVLAAFASPAAAVLVFAGLTSENIKDLALFLNDMPNQMANQLCNTFASDNPDQIDEPYWETTNEGVTVAPHDTAHLWDAPGFSNNEIRYGLWGSHIEELMLPEPIPLKKRKHVYRRSGGLAAVSGRVLYRDQPVVGAKVWIGCHSTKTNIEGQYQLEVPAGRQEITAGAYWPGSQTWLKGERVEELEPGDHTGMDITLEDPPEWRRRLEIQVNIRVFYDGPPIIGDDTWLDPEYNNYIVQTFVRYPTEWGDPPDGAPPVHWDKHWNEPYYTNYAADERVRLRVKASLDPDTLAITVTLRGELIEGAGEEQEASDEKTVTVFPNNPNPEPLDLYMESGEIPSDEGWVKAKIWNKLEPVSA